MKKAGIKIEDLHLSFGPTEVLKGVNLDIQPGEFFAFLGPSGSGKSTLLRSIAGFGPQPRGRIMIGDRDVVGLDPWRRNVGMVFQSYALWPHMSVRDNVAFGLRERRLPASTIGPKVMEGLELVGLAHLADRMPNQLSGGQQQRVALARTVVTEPTVLLLDEPLSNLDASLRVQMRRELLRLQRKLGLTTIFVTHDQEEALTLSDRIGILRAGRIVQSGPPREVYDRPADSFCAGFLGEANWIPESRLGGLSLPPANGPQLYAIRPEMLTIGQARPETGNAIRGRMLHRVFAGSMATSIVDVDGTQWKVIDRDRDIPILPEQGEVWLGWDPKDTIAVPA